MEIRSTVSSAVLRLSLLDPNYLSVEFRSAGIQFSKVVYFYADGEGLHRFFRGLANAWRGWEGAKEWSAIENDLQMSAEHDGIGHITLSIRLESDSGGRHYEHWHAQREIELVAGELEKIADDAEREFGVA